MISDVISCSSFENYLLFVMNCLSCFLFPGLQALFLSLEVQLSSYVGKDGAEHRR